MDFAEQLRVLRAAQGDPAKLALTTVDLAFPSLPDAERTALKEDLEAVAVPHWCDAGILADLLKIPPEESGERLVQLRKLKVVEPFPARGDSALNVHEAARLALRSWVAKDRPDWFRVLSRRAASHFAADETPAGQIEWIYHRLCSAPDQAATELENLDRHWSVSARPEDRQALAVALRDLVETGLVHGRARVWVSLCMAWARSTHGETAQLGGEANSILKLARESGDARAQSDALCMLGDVLQARGELEAAKAAYGENLEISRQLAEQDPSNAGWQKDLAVARSREGDVLWAQGELEAAKAAYGEYRAISRRLAEQDPSNAGWQRELALAHSREGDVLLAQGELEAAKAAYGEYLAITRRLAEQDPGNAGWQWGLAAAHSKVGDALQAQGELEAAKAAYGEYRAISQRLAEQDPSNAGWQRGLAVAHSRVGDVLQAQGELEAAKAAHGEDLEISQRLAEQDPSNAGWQEDLAVAHSRVGDVLLAQGELEAAKAAYGQHLEISQRLVDQDPSNAGWQWGLAAAHSKVGDVLQAQGKLAEAQAAYQEHGAIVQRLAE